MSFMSYEYKKKQAIKIPVNVDKINQILGIDITEGFYINDTDPNMGAHIAGIRKGDIIQQIDNVKINKFADLSGYLNSKRPGDKLNVKIFRNNKSLNVGVQLKRSTYVQFYGMQLKDASESELDELNTENGVKVVINRNGTLFRMGIRSGYILTEINNTQISNTSELKSFERADIFQITFVDLNGEKEKLIFD